MLGDIREPGIDEPSDDDVAIAGGISEGAVELGLPIGIVRIVDADAFGFRHPAEVIIRLHLPALSYL